MLKSHPGATIIADVKASQVLFDEIARAGGKPMMCKTGHSLIKSKMAEIGAPLAGEMSGHIFFADTFYGFDDALYCGAAAARHRGQRRAEPGGDARRRCRSRSTRRSCASTARTSASSTSSRRSRRACRRPAPSCPTSTACGCSTKDGWWLLRASNTQPVLVARCEAADEAGLERLMAELKAALAASGVSLPDEASAGQPNRRSRP